MRNLHNLSHEHKTTCDMGQLVPIATLEVLPGDSFIHGTSLLARVAPLVNPVMHNVDISVHHWFVPNRILWSDWDTWITGENETASKPVVDIAGSELADRMGIDNLGADVDALPFRAYNRIYNEFYRDQDLQDPVAEDQTNLLRVCWDKDYFTTARPAPQQGEAVKIGFSSGSADVVPVTGPSDTSQALSNGQSITLPDGTVMTSNVGQGITRHEASSYYTGVGSNAGTFYPQADLSTLSGGIDINDFRRSMALQRIAEARARFGERYVDYLRFLGVNPRDGRLDRPEYLGGGKQRINFSEVLATAEGANTSVGDMYGHGIAGLRARRYRKMFEEHGWVLTLLSVRPKGVYADGIPRKFLRNDPMEYWQKELETLPWQEVKARELWSVAAEDEIFGYTGRYDEYRHERNYVSGNFKGGPEEDWHFARIFDSQPLLNAAFVECVPPDRPFGDKNMPELLISASHNIAAKRLVSSNARF